MMKNFIKLLLLLGLCTFLISIMFVHINNSSVQPDQGFVVVNNASGSIIKVTKDGNEYTYYILTAAHVVEDVDVGLISFCGKYDSVGSPILDLVCFTQSNICEINTKLDYAILICKSKQYHKPIRVIDMVADIKYHQIDLLDNVCSIGNPQGNITWVSKGEVCQFTKCLDGRIHIHHNCGIWFGHSGGPLLNEDFKQIGINVNIRKTRSGQPISNMARAISLYSVYEDLGSQKTFKYFSFSS